MLKRAVLILPLALAACFPVDVAVVQQPATAVIDGASVSYNVDYLAVSRQFQPLVNSAQDKAVARAAITDYCARQGLGFLDRTATFFAADATWRFKGNCVYPNGDPVASS